MLEHTWRRAVKSRRLDGVYVVSQDREIIAECNRIGASVIVSVERASSAGLAENAERFEPATGTDRIANVVGRFAGPRTKLIVNIQADECSVSPDHIDELVETAISSDAGCTTIASPFQDWDRRELFWNGNVVKVVATPAPKRMAIHFSRASMAGSLRHVGIYAFKPEVLQQHYGKNQQSELEIAESLEQLRLISAGVPIRLCVLANAGLAVNAEEDFKRFKREVEREAERNAEREASREIEAKQRQISEETGEAGGASGDVSEAGENTNQLAVDGAAAIVH